MRPSAVGSLFAFVLVLGGGGLLGCSSGPAPSTFNCGRFDSADWTAPEGCVCTDPDGRTTWDVPGGDEEPLTCEDVRLQACPSTSGSGCSLVGMEQWPADEGDPAIVELHHDIGGHLHDLCCAAYYSGSEGPGFSTTCNGCTAQDPAGVSACEDTTVGDAVLGLPFNPAWPCAVEWRYATTAWARGPFAWWAPHDTTLRYTPSQVIARGMAGTPGRYVRPDGQGGDGVPLYGRALAAREHQPLEQRAPDGTVLGSIALSAPFHEGRSSLGLSAEQIGSFCLSARARFDEERRLWVCAPR
jgi:hypothetical protein